MELKEAIKQCEKFIKAFEKDDTKSVIDFDVQAIKIVLRALEDKENEIKELNEEIYDLINWY